MKRMGSKFWNWRFFAVALCCVIAIPETLARAARQAPKSRKDTRTLIYCDTWNNRTINTCGAPFTQTFESYLSRYNLSESQLSAMTENDDARIMSQDPVFVTALTETNREFGFACVAKMFETFQKRFFVIDLGLSAESRAALLELKWVYAIQRFEFPLYPNYVQILKHNRWKPLIIAEMLRAHEAVFYADADATLALTPDLSGLLSLVRCPNGAKCDYYNYLSLWPANNSIYAATHLGTFGYLPMDQERAKKIEMGSSIAQLIYYTKDVRQNIMKWLVLCALEQKCMGPIGSQPHCDFKGDAWHKYAGCHRYDESAMNILLANRNQYVSGRYIERFANSECIIEP